MKKISKYLKTTLAALTCAIIATACSNDSLNKRDEEPAALPGISVEDARPLGQIGHNTKMFTAEEVAQNIAAAQSLNVYRFTMLEGDVASALHGLMQLQTDFENFTNNIPSGGTKPVYPAVTTNSIVAGDQTLLVLSPIEGTSDSLPPYVTNSITAGDETIYVLSPAE